MNHEEFVRLSKLEVTTKFYRDVIDPQYVETNADKEDFVEQWLNENKKYIVKAHMIDVNSASVNLSVGEVNKSKLEELKRENEQLQNQAEAFERNFKAANSSWQEAKHQAESWRGECYEARNQAKQVEPLNNRIHELEGELTRLKARLFDMMEQTI